jgi:hypothetical protein
LIFDLPFSLSFFLLQGSKSWVLHWISCSGGSKRSFRGRALEFSGYYWSDVRFWRKKQRKEKREKLNQISTHNWLCPKQHGFLLTMLLFFVHSSITEAIHCSHGSSNGITLPKHRSSETRSALLSYGSC